MVVMQLNPGRLRPNWVNRLHEVARVYRRREHPSGDFGLWVDTPIVRGLGLGSDVTLDLVIDEAHAPRGIA
jgi:hypothetical protein